MNRTRSAPVALVAALCLLHLTCTPTEARSRDRDADPAALGSLKVSSKTLGQPPFAPSICTAGARQFFLGADFSDERAGLVLRIVVDPLDGPAVRVFAPASPLEKTVVFRRTECRVFQLALEATNLMVNRIQDYRVSLDLDCTTAGGDAISGKVAASHCH